MDDERYDDIESMLKLKYERRLMTDISGVFEEFAKKDAVYKVGKKYGKKFKNRSLRRAYRLYLRGTKELDRKIPVFIELPKLEEQTNGQYREVKENKKDDIEQTIVVSDLPEQIEAQREETRKLIDGR